MEKDFKSLGLDEKLVHGLALQGIHTPTEIQSMVVNPFLEGKDLIAQSETGSGKTLSYLLPLFCRLDPDVRNAQAIVLTPTHELAVQVARQATLLAENSGIPIRTAFFIGGAGIGRQLEKLKEKPQLIIGSAGRILDFIQKKKINAQTVRTIVIDEADRMLDSLNVEAVQAVIKTTLRDRQIVALSASMKEEILVQAQEMMKQPVLVRVSHKNTLPASIQHCYIQCGWRDKINMIRKIVYGETAEKTIVFLNNPENIEVTVEKLNFHLLKAAGIYGGAYKTERKQALEDFREGRVKVLVASDIGARGLDISDVTHVINLDIPEDPVFYLHRAGRTGRQGKSGLVISVVTEQETKWIRKYEKAFDISIDQKEMTFGRLSDIRKKAEQQKKNSSIQIDGKKWGKKVAVSGKKVEKSDKKGKKKKI